jgi:hypothetical protein
MHAGRAVLLLCAVAATALAAAGTPLDFSPYPDDLDDVAAAADAVDGGMGVAMRDVDVAALL